MRAHTITPVLITALLITTHYAAAQGSLTPTNAPAPTMHSLEEIYQNQTTLQANQAALEARLAEIEQRMASDGLGEVVDGMVLVPGGDFAMGDAFGEGHSDERPVHTVTVSAFYMDQYEVTKAKWDEVANWAETNNYDIAASDGPGKENGHPVHTVTWYECVKWANARSEMAELTPCYYTGTPFGIGTVYRAGTITPLASWLADGYRLPTEAEWEKAARGGATGRRFPGARANLIDHYLANYKGDPSGYSYDTSLVADHHPAFLDGTVPYTSPVGSFAPNGYGLYDMAGNVWEWCWDRYDSGYYASSPATNPHGPASNSGRVIRSGCWYWNASYCRVAGRDYHSPAYESSIYHDLGFRLVRSAP